MTIARGEPLLASDMLDLTFFPIGTILMYDGTNWSNGRGGWYICDGANGTPDLRDKFIKGTGSLFNTGGSNTLTAAMLPKHIHSISGTVSGGGAHGHIIRTGYGKDDMNFGGNGTYIQDSDTGDGPHLKSGVITGDGEHSHTISATIANDNSVTTDSNTSNMPLYYSLIYIRKCT
jgi:hypothetical protein